MKSSNPGGDGVRNCHPAPYLYRCARILGRVDARSNGLNGTEDPTIDKIQHSFALSVFDSSERGLSRAHICLLQKISEFASVPSAVIRDAFLSATVAVFRMQWERCN